MKRLQKATYFLQEVLDVETGFEFILFKHGPYSFDLSEELTSLRADALLKWNHRSPEYGPTLVPTESSAELRKQYPNTLAIHARKIRFITQTFGSKGVTELEKLATALWVTRELGNRAGIAERAERLNELKPHVSLDDAVEAVREFDRIAAKANAITRGDSDD